MSFTYTLNIPFSSNNPSTDQPNMLANTNSISNLISVDHVGFNTATGGQHLQVTFPAENTPATPAGIVGVLYTQAGVAAVSQPQLMFVNSNATFPVSLTKAYATFTGATGTIVSSQSIGVASVSAPVAGVFTVTLNANVVTGTSYSVYVTATGGLSSPTVLPIVTISSATSFTISQTEFTSSGRVVSFIVTQL